MDIEVIDIDHVAIRVSDIDAALAFYGDALGLDVRDRDRFERGDAPFPSVVAGSKHVHLYPTTESVEIDREHICFLLRSEEIDAYEQVEDLIARLQATDVPVEEPEPLERRGAYGVGWATYVSDPDGRRVELKVH